MKRMRLSVGFVVMLIAAIAMLCFIWGNSMVPGAQSDAISIGFRNFLAAKLNGISWINVPGNAVMRKLAHVTEFTVLAIILAIIIKGMMRVSCGWVLLAGMSTALIDETIQLFTGSRTSSVKDIWIDMSGFCTGVIVIMLAMFIWRAVKHR